LDLLQLLLGKHGPFPPHIGRKALKVVQILYVERQALKVVRGHAIPSIGSQEAPALGILLRIVKVRLFNDAWGPSFSL
jgi:hypothetical protein